MKPDDERLLRLCLQKTLFSWMKESPHRCMRVIQLFYHENHPIRRDLDLLTATVFTDFDGEIADASRYIPKPEWRKGLPYTPADIDRAFMSNDGVAPEPNPIDVMKGLVFTHDEYMQCSNVMCFGVETHLRLNNGVVRDIGKLPQARFISKSLPSLDICIACARQTNNINNHLLQEAMQKGLAVSIINQNLHFVEPYGPGGYEDNPNNELVNITRLSDTRCLVNQVDYGMVQTDDLVYLTQDSINFGSPKNV